MEGGMMGGMVLWTLILESFVYCKGGRERMCKGGQGKEGKGGSVVEWKGWDKGVRRWAMKRKGVQGKEGKGA